MANSSNNNKVKVVELDDEIEGGHVDTTDYYFDKVGEPVPIKRQDSNFDAGSPPSQPLAISEIHGLIVVAHSGGFCVARTKDVIASAKDIKEKGSGPSIQELSVVDVPIGKVHILAISTDNSTLAAAIASDVHFFPLNSLLNKESKPSFSCSLNQSSFVSDLRWRKKAENSFVVLSNSGNLYHGAVDGPLKDLMNDVDAVEWSVKGKFVAVARKKVLCILSSRFKERLCMPLSWKKGFSDSEVNCSIKVDSIKWVRPDCIILGCFQLAADGKVENYLVQVIRSKDGKITDGSVKPVVLSFYDLFLGFIDDILPFGSGPLLFLSYLEQCELAITANRNNTDRHIVLLGWSLADEINEVAVVDIEREKWLPRIELQENEDDNLILGLCVDKTSLYEKVKIQLGIEEHRELSPYCILLCLTLEGKLAMFHVASVGGTSVPPVVTSAPSEEEEEEEDTHAVIPVECHLSKPSLGLDKQEFKQVSSGIQFQDVNKKELNTKEDGKINKKSFSKPFDLSKSSVSPVVASPISLRESNSKNWKGESQSNSESFETDKQHTIPDTKWYQDTDGQQVQPFRQQSPEFYQSNFKASSNTVKDFSKMGTQEIADLESSTSVEGRSSADILGQSNRKNLLNSVGMGKESMGNIGTTSLQTASSHSWTNGKFIYPRDNSARSEFSFSGSIQGNQTENSGISFGAANVSGGLAVKPFHLKDSSSTSTSVNFTGRPAQGGGQRTLTGSQNVESLPSFGSSQMSVQENFAAGKSLNHKLQPSKEDNKFPPLSGMLNSEPNLSKQFGNINGMTKELDALLESIEVEGSFRDACTIYQNSSVEALEQGMSTLSDQCRTWKGIVKERLGKVQHLLDKTVQVSARKIYMEGIVKQASDSRYWDLWNRQKLSSELELKRRHIQQMNQDLTNQLIELERHFNGLELNKFGANAGAHVAQTAFQSRFRPSRRIQSLHSLHSTASSLSAAAEQLSEYLSKQMAVLSIESQVKQQNIKKELFETVGIPYDASFSSPDATKVSDSPSREKLFSLGSAAAKDRSKRNQLSSMKCSEPETATRRRDPLHQSWTAFEPSRTTVERILLDESQKTSVTRSSYSMDKQQFSPSLPESSAIAHHTALSTFYPSEYNGMQDTSTKNASKNPIQFSWANKLLGSSQTFGQKSPTLQRDNATASSSQSSSQFAPILAKGPTREGFDMATENSFNGSVPVNDAKPMLQSNTNQNQKLSISTMLPTQTVSLLKTSNVMSNSNSKETMVSSSRIGTIKDEPSSTKSSPLESRKIPDTSFSSIFNTSAVPSLTGKDHLDVPVGNSPPGDNELASMFSVPLSAPLFPMINPTTASLSSSSTPATVQTLSSSIPPSRSFTTFNASTDANQKVSTLTFPSLSAPSFGSFSLQPSKMQVPSCTSATSESPRIELQPPMGKLNVTTDMDGRKQAPPLQPAPPNDDVKLRLEPSATAGHTIEISTGPSSGSQPCFSNMASRAPNVTLNAQPEQPSAARILFPTPPPTSGSGTSGKIESSDVAVTEEDEMDEEAPDTSNTAELTLGSLGGFGIGSTPVPTAPKLNPFGGSFGNAASSPLSSEFNMTVPSGELFRPASFNFQSPQSSQPSQPTNSSAFSGGFSAGTTAQAQSQTGFGQPTQIGSGQQALGSVLGAFGQSRQLGTGLPGIGFATPSGFGGGSSSTGGFSSATSGGGFAGLASGNGGFAGVAPGVGAFSGVASAGGGFAGAASVGGFGPVSSGGFPAAGSVFGAFNSQQGGGGFSAFSTSTGGTGKPSELITRMRK